MVSTHEALAAEWRARNPQTDADIAAFYRESTALAADLAAWHQTPERQALTAAIVALAKERGVKSVLDVGCGRGDDLHALAQAMVPELVGVEPNTTLLSDTCARIFGDVPATGDGTPVCTFSAHADLATVRQDFTPDLTLLIDVLEHLPNPKVFLEQVLARVPVGGLLIEASATHDTSTPLHLRANQGWKPAGQIQQAGFQLVGTWFERVHVYQRMGVEAMPSQSILLCAWREVKLGSFDSIYNLMRRYVGMTGYDPKVPLWNVMLQAGDAAIFRARARIVTKWWQETPDDVFLMLDDDIVFHPDVATRILEHARRTRSIVCAAYATKGATHFACQLYAGQQVRFAPDAELTEIKYPATGFMAVHRDVIDALIPTVPLVNMAYTGGYFPIFQPMNNEFAPGEWEELTEDFAFGERARQAGFKIWLDPSIYLEHEGIYRWSISDVVDYSAQGKGFLQVLDDAPVADDLANDPRLAEMGVA